VLQSHVIGTDDTVMPMLAPEKTRQARMWVYVGDAANPYNVFDFTLSRSRDGPAKFLGDYKQTLLADAYGGYDGVVVATTSRAPAAGRTRGGSSSMPRRRIRRSPPRRWRGSSGCTPSRNAARPGCCGAPGVASKGIDPDPGGVERSALYAWRDQLLPKHPMSEAVGYA
jgi:transposase